EQADKKFKEIGEAYAVLSNEGEKKRYDASLASNSKFETSSDFDLKEYFETQLEVIGEEIK
ncbi:8401_t:CDS:1, partial [Paraglomus occultum]